MAEIVEDNRGSCNADEKSEGSFDSDCSQLGRTKIEWL